MNKLAKFEKVSLGQFQADCQTQDAKKVLDELKIPRRATVGSCGYDFFAPFDLKIQAGETLTVPSGIRAVMPQNWALLIFPRSGLGFKFRMRLNNTVGVVDSDYAFSDNQGHIFVKISNEGDKDIEISQGTAFCQGVFLQYGLTEDDDVDQQRNGGIGSTDC